MENNWKEYFTFTKKERTGIGMLVVLIGIVTAIPYFFPRSLPPDKEAIAIFNEKQSQLSSILADSARANQQEAATVIYEPANTRVVSLFPFDPNTLNAEGWEKLGLKSGTIRTIRNYLAKGGRFRKPEDVQKIYGLSKSDYNRLKPYIQIPAQQHTGYYTPAYKKEKYVKPAPLIIDINMADTTALIALPGIGSKLANRIIHFREKLGGFYSVQQVSETFGLPDSTFQLVKSQLQCLPVTIRKININTADVNTLKQHPYIRWNIANAIVQFRLQHGVYQTVEDLQQIAIITPELYQKIAGYLAVE